MIDEKFNTWLIEINSSPSMSYSSPLKERLTKQVFSDVPKVILDYQDSKHPETVDTGHWTQIFKGCEIASIP